MAQSAIFGPVKEEPEGDVWVPIEPVAVAVYSDARTGTSERLQMRLAKPEGSEGNESVGRLRSFEATTRWSGGVERIDPRQR